MSNTIVSEEYFLVHQLRTDVFAALAAIFTAKLNMENTFHC